MADSISFEHLDGILHLTADEKRFYKQIFIQADTDGSGVITGDVAVKFLEKTGVPSHVLGEIWQIADQENRGFLQPAGFAVCLRLIAQYQNGKDPDSRLAFQPAPLPKFDGVDPPQPAGLQPQLSGTGPIRVPPLSPEKATDYAGLFDRSGSLNGVMPGDKAKEIFEKARLPNEILGRIWNLADTEERGALSVTEFIIAMHLLASYKSRTMAGIPATLPAGLWEAAARRIQPGPPAGGSLLRQLSGASGPIRTGSPQTRAPFSPAGASPTQQSNWVVTPQDKQQFDVLFNKVDGSRTGFINGDQAVAFFSESGLHEDFLAQIWDLSDINSEGKLNKDEFALAMHLIRLQRGKTQSVLPTTLPPNFVPPSMRNQARPPSQSTAPAFDNAAAASTATRSATEDLFGLDVLTASQVPQSTGGSAAPLKIVADPFGSQPSSPKVGQAPAGASSFKPFIPSSTFGRGLQHQDTGASAGSAGSSSRGLQQPSAMDDLLGDNDPEVSKKLTNETAELANMSNQIGTLRTQMQEVQQKKTVSETDLDRTSKQKHDLELRLSQFRQQYENEIRAVKELEQKLSASKTNTEKLKREQSTLEGSFRDLQGQHQQLAQALAADQQENTSLKQKITETNSQIGQIKPQLERLRAEARLEKGRVAINKKQLATNESERDKTNSDIADLKRGAAESARASPTAPTVNVASPALSTTSQSTNPFFRRSPQQSFDNTMSPASLVREAPASSAQSKNTQEDFDNFFNTTAFSSSQGSAPPPTTFRSESSTVTPAQPPAAATPPLSVINQESPQPPPPPESRQITSKELPLQPPAERAESFSSSVRVQTPASRVGDSGAATPTPGFGLDPKAAMLAVAADRAATSTPPVGGGIPGAFPDPSPSINRAGTADSRPDFDSAFANYNGSATAQETTAPDPSLNGAISSDPQPSKLNQEFPPIQDVEPEDEDDSSDEETGFDDNFGSSPRNKQSEGQATPANVTPAGETSQEDDLYAPRPQVQQASSFVSDLPTPNAQKSPPTYGETMAEGSHDPSSFPPEFGGLLPSREDPTHGVTQPEQEEPAMISHEQSLDEDEVGGPVGGSDAQNRSLFGDDSTSTPKGPNQQGIQDSSSTKSDAFHSVASFSSAQNNDAHAVQNGKPVPADDFDSGFDDLDQARDHDHEDVDDSFVHANQHQEGFDEFNPTFDSPAASKANTMASAGPTPSGSRIITNAPQTSSFGDFEDEIEDAFSGGKAAASQPTAAGAAPPDWDNIFSSLDKSPSAPRLDASGGFPAVNHTATRTTAVADDMLDVPPPPGPPPSKAAQMPKLGRAISTGTEHDDPILKRLTAKGFARDDAVRALEQYDYDSDKALEFLSQPYLTQLTGMGYKKEDAVRALKAYDYDLSKAADYLTSST